MSGMMEVFRSTAIDLSRGCLHDTGATLSKFIPVPSYGSAFVYMITPENVILV